MSSSENTKSTKEQINNYKNNNNASIASIAVATYFKEMEQQKDSILDNINSEKAWVKISQNASVHLKKGRPVMESTFRID